MSQRAGSALHDPLIQFFIRGLNPSVSSKPAVGVSSVQSWPNHSYVGIAVLRNARLRATAIHTRLSGGLESYVRFGEAARPRCMATMGAPLSARFAA